MMNMAMLVETADKMLKIRNKTNELRYIVRLPSVSLKLLHQSGKMLILSMYIATLRLTTVGVELNSVVISPSAGKMMEEPIGAAAAATATTKVIIHFFLLV
jgi:riboflavin transporter FmnP